MSFHICLRGITTCDRRPVGRPSDRSDRFCVCVQSSEASILAIASVIGQRELSCSLPGRFGVAPRARLLAHQQKQEQRDKHENNRQTDEEQRRALNVGVLHRDAEANHR